MVNAHSSPEESFIYCRLVKILFHPLSFMSPNNWILGLQICFVKHNRCDQRLTSVEARSKQRRERIEWKTEIEETQMQAGVFYPNAAFRFSPALSSQTEEQFRSKFQVACSYTKSIRWANCAARKMVRERKRHFATSHKNNPHAFERH